MATPLKERFDQFDAALFPVDAFAGQAGLFCRCVRFRLAGTG